MPVYTYHCDNCEHEFDKHQSFNEEALAICPECRKHQLRKVYSPAGIVFKGSGFYINDKKAPSSSKKTADAKSNGKSAPKDSKSKSKEKSPKSKSTKTKVT